MTNLLVIDEFDIARHRRNLTIQDRCYFYFTYNGKADYINNPTRSMIKNLKRSPSELKGNPTFTYFKNKEIDNVSKLIYETIIEQPQFLDYIWIPVAPSKEKSDPEYDDRLIQILLKVQKMLPKFRFLEIFSTKISTPPSHQTNKRDITEKIQNLEIDNYLISQLGNNPILIFDDMITSGATFCAYKRILNQNNCFAVEGFFLCKATSDI
ncbi:TPA: hypothetical protein JBG22_14170, partial [Legionella pneumophila]|nr:hypothetical protein [Legionella pneumophila]